MKLLVYNKNGVSNSTTNLTDIKRTASDVKKLSMEQYSFKIFSQNVCR